MSASADSVAPEDCLPRQLPEILGDLADRTGDGDSSASITADSSGLQHELCGSFGWLQFFFGRKDKGRLRRRRTQRAVWQGSQAREQATLQWLQSYSFPDQVKHSINSFLP